MRRVERCGPGYCGCRAVKRCIGAEQQGREKRGQQKERSQDRDPYSHKRTTRWKQHSLNGSQALLVDLVTGVCCVQTAAGLQGRTPGGRRIEVMRAVASSADEVALRSHNRRLVQHLHACPAQQLVFRGRIGEQCALSMRCQDPSVVILSIIVPDDTMATRI
jgi:hypothetical protein